MDRDDSVLMQKVRGPKMRISGFPAMEPLCNALASHAATMARKSLRKGLDVTIYGYEVVRHGEYLKYLHAPSAIYLMSFPEVGGSGLIKAHPRLLGKTLDLSLGGDGSFEQTGDGRDMTAIDLAIYGKFVDMMCAALHEAVMELCGRSAIGCPQRTRFEEQPGLVRIAPDRAEVFVIKLNFHIGDDRRGAGMDYVIPVSTLTPLQKDLSATVPTDAPTAQRWASYMYDKVMELPVRADGVIPLGKFTVAELSRLEQGLLIELPGEGIEDIEVQVETADGIHTLTRAKLGAHGRQKALRLRDDPDAAFLQPLQEMERPQLLAAPVDED